MKNYEISDTLKNDILVTMIEPNFKSDITRNLKLRKKFKACGICFETTSKFLVGVGSVLSFASGIYKYDILSFVAGTTSVLSLVMLQYSSFCYKESKKMTLELNEILKKLHIPTINIDNTSSVGSLDQNDPQTPIFKESLFNSN
jgi:membrane protein DedA with SNARE-associated domain